MKRVKLGRPFEEPSTRIRVPNAILEKVEKMIQTHKERMKKRREQQDARKGTDAAQYFKGHKYVPGNGPNHKLGKVSK